MRSSRVDQDSPVSDFDRTIRAGVHHTRLQSLGNGSFRSPFELECSTWRSTAGAVKQASPGLRRRTMSAHSLNIHGMIVSDDIDSLAGDSERLQMITNLGDSVSIQGRMLNSFWPGRAPGRCGCAVTSLLERGCGGAFC